jgi:hypothetical protein
MTLSGIHYSLNGTAEAFLGQQMTGFYIDPYSGDTTLYHEDVLTEGTYTSASGSNTMHQITTKFFVDNGAWDMTVKGKDITMDYAKFTCDTGGTFVYHNMVNGTYGNTTTANYARKWSSTQTVTTDWGTNEDTVVKIVTVSSDDWRTSSEGSNGRNSLNQTLDWTNEITGTNGVMTSTVYEGNGTASGKGEKWGNGNYRLDTFDGTISRDANTGMFSADSAASTIGFGYAGTVIEHSNTYINYLGFVYLVPGQNGGYVNISTGPTIMPVTQYVMQQHPNSVSDWDNFSYNRPVSVFTGTFVIDGNSVGAGFQEATLRDFDSGIEQFIPPVAPPDYTPPMDWEGAFLPQLTPLEAFGASIKSNSHTALDVAGMLPIVGAPADALNAAIYFAEGDYVNGSISVAGMVPGLGEAAVGAKMLNKGAKAAKKAGAAADLGKQAAKHADDVASSCKQAKNGMKTNCFTEGTQIVVGAEYDADGNFVSYVTVNIEDIKVGDLVYSYNTATGEVGLREVTDTFVRTSDHINYLTIVDECGNEQTIETTDGHPFWVVTDNPDMNRAARDYVFENGSWLYHEDVTPTEFGYWVEAKDLRVGDVFLGANGELSVLVDSVRVGYAENITVYNFSVGENHNYFIIARDDEYGQTCILVHNAKYPKGQGTAAVDRARSRAQGIPEHEIGPSGLPKIHSPQLPSRKAAQDAAQAVSGKGGTLMEHVNPAVGNSHYHAVKPNGVKVRTHFEYLD